MPRLPERGPVRPVDRKAAATSPVHPASGEPRVLPLAFAAVAIGYALLMLAVDGSRRSALAMLLLPDELLAAWCGGNVASFTLLDRWPVVLGALAVLATAWLAGRLALWPLGLAQELDRLERYVFAQGAGLQLVSLWALLVGLAGGLQQRWLFLGPMILLGIGGAIWLARRRRRADDSSGGTDAEPSVENDRRWWWLLLLAVPFVLPLLLGSMLPPWEYDVREYHLQVPKEWFRAGRIAFLPHNVYGNMPLGSELHSLWGMALAGGDDAWWWGALIGKSVMACYSLVTGAALVAFGRRAHSLAAGVAAAVLYLATPWTVMVGQIGHNEGPLALFALLALFAVWRGGHCNTAGCGARFLLLAGWFAGSAVACKYPAALFLVVPLILWIGGLGKFVRSRWQEARGDAGFRWREGLLRAALFLLAALAACGPWLAKNAALAGNPTYPLLFDLFGGRSWNAEKNARWERVHSPQADSAGRRYSPTQLWQGIVLATVKSHGLGLLLLPLAAFAWLARPLRPLLLAGLLWTAFVFVAWWLVTHRIDRFLVPVLPAVALAAGIGVVALPDKGWRQATLTLLALSLVAQWALVMRPEGIDLRFFAPLANLRDDPDRLNPGHRYLNEHVPAGSRVLLVGDAEPFDLVPHAIYNTCFDDCQFTRLFEGRTRQERLQALDDEQITHVLIHWGHLDRFRRPGNYGYTSDYPTREVVRGELVQEQQLLRPIPLEGISSESVELFEVTR